MRINGVTIDDTFAEAFPMRAARLVITAIDLYWAYRAANSLTGFASSVIACGCEAAIEAELTPDQTPDGRPGVAVIVFAMGRRQLAAELQRRVGQSVMTTATAACFSGLDTDERLPLGRALRYFGDGYQIAKVIGGERYWRVPVMHGEFVCQDTVGVVPAIGGGNFLILARSTAEGLLACRQAVAAIDAVPGAVTPFPGGVVGSGSKVGSRYRFLTASTNERFCPTLKGVVADSALEPEVGSVLEIVIDGLDQAAVREAMRVGIRAACAMGRERGIYRVSAGNYGGRLGPHHFHLREVLA